MRRLRIAGRATPTGSGDPLRGVVGQGVSAPAGGTETIGNEATGGTSTAFTGGRLYMVSHDIPVHSGTFQSIFLYSSNTTSTTDIEFGLYDGATFSTATYVGKKAFTNITAWTLTSKEFDVSDQSWSAVAGHTYWITVNCNDTTNLVVYYDAQTGGTHYKALTYGNAWPDPFGASDNDLDRQYEIKATINY